MKRVESIDALRGFDMMLLMGFMYLWSAFADWTKIPWVMAVDRQMHHSEWIGLTVCDMIFPTFLFLAGLSWAFSLAAQREKGVSDGAIVRRVLKRMVTLVVLGAVYSGFFRFDFAHMRWGNVLTRIGVTWAIAALLTMKLRPSRALAVWFALFAGYWAFLSLTPHLYAPEGTWAFDPKLNAVLHYDDLICNGRRPDAFGSEGIFSAFGALQTALLGAICGGFLRRSDLADDRKPLWMLGAAVVLAVGGALCHLAGYPLCEGLWTGTFALSVAAIDLAILSVVYWIADVRGHVSWLTPFKVIGMNAVTIYVLQRVVDFRGIGKFFLGGVIRICPESATRTLVELGGFLSAWAFLWFLYRKRLFFKV